MIRFCCLLFRSRDKVVIVLSSSFFPFSHEMQRSTHPAFLQAIKRAWWVVQTKEFSYCQAVQRKKILAMIQINLQKIAKCKSWSYFEATQCFKQVGCWHTQMDELVYVVLYKLSIIKVKCIEDTKILNYFLRSYEHK